MGGAADKDLLPLCPLAPLLFIWALQLRTSIRRFIDKEPNPKSFTRSQKVTSQYMKTSVGCTWG